MSTQVEILTSITEQFLPQMTPAERRAALESLQRIIDAEFFKLAEGASSGAEACPCCGSMSFVKRGHDHLGKQRYKCRDCGRTFVGSARKIFGTTKLDRATWMKYAECFVDAITLRRS